MLCSPREEGRICLALVLEARAGWVHANDNSQVALHLCCEIGEQVLGQQSLRGKHLLQWSQGAVQLLISEQAMHLTPQMDTT